MKFEFKAEHDFNFLDAFAERFKIPVFKNSLVFPETMGKGFIKAVAINPSFKLVIHHYTLNESLNIKYLPSTESSDLISIVFNCYGMPITHPDEMHNACQFLKEHGSAIQIVSSEMSVETFIPGNSEVCFVSVFIRRSELATILKIENSNVVTEEILGGNTTFFFHERMSVNERRLILEISRINEFGELSNLYYRIKAEELLLLLFTKLLSRKNLLLNTIRNSDVEKIFAIRGMIVENLSKQPDLRELSIYSGIGENKMKKLFKHVFGETIFSFYQRERMEHAAFLLKKAGYSVSEAGYHLGYSNLSHFGRLFEKYFGVTPKKYSYLI